MDIQKFCEQSGCFKDGNNCYNCQSITICSLYRTIVQEPFLYILLFDEENTDDKRIDQFKIAYKLAHGTRIFRIICCNKSCQSLAGNHVSKC